MSTNETLTDSQLQMVPAYGSSSDIMSVDGESSRTASYNDLVQNPYLFLDKLRDFLEKIGKTLEWVLHFFLPLFFVCVLCVYTKELFYNLHLTEGFLLCAERVWICISFSWRSQNEVVFKWYVSLYGLNLIFSMHASNWTSSFKAFVVSWNPYIYIRNTNLVCLWNPGVILGDQEA